MYTSFFGARHFATGNGYIAQETKLWVDRYGAPRKIVNPVGHQTIVKREEGQWAALATEEQAPNGFVTRGRYDARGNIAASIAVQPLGPSQGDATTRYHWDQKWDFVDSIVSPLGVTTTMAYDTGNGNRQWQQLGPDAVRRVQFQYWNGIGLLMSTILPGTPPDSIEYDGMGNVSVVRTPKRFDTRYTHDAFGRDTMVQVRLDTLAATYQVTRTRFDALDRDTMQISAGPPLGGAPAETVYVRKSYNKAGQLDSLSRWSRPSVTPIGTLTTRWKYDTAGRVVAEVAPDQFPDSMFYDAAGNDTLSVTRRRDRITMTYDALNRLSIRRVPSYSYPSRPSDIHNSGSNPPTLYDPYVTPADTQTFTYDSLGNIRTARNTDARVTRTYFPNGLLNSDNLIIRTVQGWDSTKHAYSVGHVYDLDGRETQLNLPAQLASSGQTDITYSYDPQIGLLTSVSDVQDSVYGFTYTSRMEVASLQFPARYLQRLGYDADGRIAADTILNQGGTSAPRWNADTIRSSRFWYDAANRLLRRADWPALFDTLTTAYSGLGHLVTSNLVQYGGLPSAPCGWYKHTVNEVFTSDALGNRAHGETTNTFTTSSCPNTFAPHGSGYNSVGRLITDTLNLSNGVMTFQYDSAGNETFSQSLAGPEIERASYYGADGRVRAIDARTSYGNFNPWTRAFDEYRYDALGRRIWVRSRKSCYVGSFTPPFAAECTSSLVRRTVWNGDQMLAEIQMPGGDTDSQYWENDTAAVLLPSFYASGYEDPARYFGRIVYTHAGGIDHPIAITRYKYVHAVDLNGQPQQPTVIPRVTIMPFWNSLGDAPLGAFSDGTAMIYCVTPVTNCEDVTWPYTFSAYNRHGGGLVGNWQGSVLEGGRDKSGLEFKRNRLYDPQTGRFTQEDPIGLAGGLNLYGFAGGDPVNFADPFGLDCPAGLSALKFFLCNTMRAGWEGLGALVGFGIGGGTGALETVASGGALAPVAVVQTVAATAAGAAIGTKIGDWATDQLFSDESGGGGGGANAPQYKIPRNQQSAQEASKDIPSWAQGQRPLVGEKGRTFAQRLLDQQYGAGKWKGTGPASEFSKLKKYADRHFMDPPK